jgi:acetyltransferase-like isoleucine patch superfamily enzyme
MADHGNAATHLRPTRQDNGRAAIPSDAPPGLLAVRLWCYIYSHEKLTAHRAPCARTVTVRSLNVGGSGKEKMNPFDSGYYGAHDLRQFGFKAVGENVKIAKDCIIIGLPNISFGNNVRIDSGTTIAAHSGPLVVGSYVHISGGCYIASAGGVTLDDFSGLSHGVKLFSGSDDYTGMSMTNPTVPSQFTNVKIAPVRVGRHVIIGVNSVVLPGCNLEDGCSVGALSLVTKSLEAWHVYHGNPVQKIKPRSKQLLEHEASLMEMIGP